MQRDARLLREVRSAHRGVHAALRPEERRAASRGSACRHVLQCAARLRRSVVHRREVRDRDEDVHGAAGDRAGANAPAAAVVSGTGPSRRGAAASTTTTIGDGATTTTGTTGSDATAATAGRDATTACDATTAADATAALSGTTAARVSPTTGLSAAAADAAAAISGATAAVVSTTAADAAAAVSGPAAATASTAELPLIAQQPELVSVSVTASIPALQLSPIFARSFAGSRAICASNCCCERRIDLRACSESLSHFVNFMTAAL